MALFVLEAYQKLVVLLGHNILLLDYEGLHELSSAGWHLPLGPSSIRWVPLPPDTCGLDPH